MPDEASFWRSVTSTLCAEVFGDNPSLSARAMYFKAQQELNKLGFGTDYSDHPRNPLPKLVEPVKVRLKQIASTKRTAERLASVGMRRMAAVLVER